MAVEIDVFGFLGICWDVLVGMFEASWVFDAWNMWKQAGVKKIGLIPRTACVTLCVSPAIEELLEVYE